jgi:penicillin-binding protein 1C
MSLRRLENRNPPSALRIALRRWGRRLVIGFVILFCAAWVALKFIAIPSALLTKPPESVELVDRAGRSLRQTSVGERFRREVSYADIPQNVVHAMLAAEDKRFFGHGGVDWLATGRAAWTSARAGRKKSGASTITQQLIKLSVPRERTFTTKFIEMATALRLEQLWSKEQILAAYLNRVDFGNLNHGIVAAANFYFGKPLRDLSDAEAALLAGLPWNPSRINPLTNLNRAKARQETVLRRMQQNGWLTAEQHDRASGEPLRFITHGRDFQAPHFADLALEELSHAQSAEAARVGEQAASARLYREGIVATTLDLELNQFIERSVQDQLSRLRSENVRNAAVVVLENRTGAVLGLVGSENYFAPRSGMVNGATQPRSAGSTIKPVTYLLALERGATAATVFPDVPTEFPTPTGPYRPENYHRHCQGPARLREALACSLNIPAVKALQSLGGSAPLHARLKAWGMTTLTREPDEYGLGLTIGNAEVRLIELANVYATLARLGEWRPLRLLASGPAQPAPAGPPRASAELCWLIADILSDNNAREPAFGAVSALRFDFPVACKTGTSTDFRDNWAMAYTPEFTVGVWVGNFNGAPMREVSGVTGAAPIMHDVMGYLRHRFGTTWFARPSQIEEHTVHRISGKQVAADDRNGMREKFVAANVPAMAERSDYDAGGRVLLGPEFAAWAASADNQLREQVAISGDGGLHLVSPTPGATFLLDPDVPSSALVPLVATGAAQVIWESATLKFRDQSGQRFAVAKEGEHRLTARDPQSGRALTTWIRVKAL